MLTSSFTLDPTPSAPAGYRPGCIVRHPLLVLNLVSAAVFILGLPLLGVITLELQGALALPVELVLNVSDIASALGASISTIFLHELIHGGLLRHYGYRASYGVEWRLFVAYTAAFGQFQQRDHAVQTALAPLMIITIAMLPLLAVPNHYIVTVAFAALLTNTPGAVGDLYLAWRLLRLPRQTLVYDVDPQQMLIYLPDQR